jgi:hypothetical protein
MMEPLLQTVSTRLGLADVLLIAIVLLLLVNSFTGKGGPK